MIFDNVDHKNQARKIIQNNLKLELVTKNLNTFRIPKEQGHEKFQEALDRWFHLQYQAMNDKKADILKDKIKLPQKQKDHEKHNERDSKRQALHRLLSFINRKEEKNEVRNDDRRPSL